MSSALLPISCISCRKRKIKCNRIKPCDQCIKRHLPCEFPEKFRNIKIQEDEIKPELDGEPKLEPEDDMNSIYDYTRKPSENLSISTSGSASILSSAPSKSTDSTDSIPTSTDSATNSDSREKCMVTKNHSTGKISHSSPSAIPITVGSLNNSIIPSSKNLIDSDAPNQDSDNLTLLRDDYDIMKAANTQLLSSNRLLKRQLEELQQSTLSHFRRSDMRNCHDNAHKNGSCSCNKTTKTIDNGNHNRGDANANLLPNLPRSGDKRANTSDSFSDESPNKKEKVGVFGYSKSSFPKDSASQNQGIYSNNQFNEDNSSSPPKETSTTSTDSSSSGGEIGQTLTFQPLSKEQRELLNGRKVHRVKRNRGQGFYEHQVSSQPPVNKNGLPNRLVNHNHNWEQDAETYQDQESIKSSIQIQKSLKKKTLPILPSYLLKYDDPGISVDSTTYQDISRLNFEVVVKLVEKFFENNSYYRTFISSVHVFDFLNGYNSINDRDWENDDDLLLVYMILCLSIERLSPQDFVELNLLPDGSLNVCTKYRKFLTRQVLYKSFERLKENLVDESMITIQTYILCSEWLFLQQNYEECWQMMFHACSISFSIGLHIMNQFRETNTKENKPFKNVVDATMGESDSSSEKKDTMELEEDKKNEDEELNAQQYRLWYALKYLTSVICSIFGRPNPISVKVGMIDSTPLNQIDQKLHVLLKSESSELLRLSNLMLIENYMIDISFENVMTLKLKFDTDILTLEDSYDSIHGKITCSLIGGSEQQNKSNDNANKWIGYDDYTKGSLTTKELDVLSDTIILHINSVKLLEPFVKKYETQKGKDTLSEKQIDSIGKFLQLLNVFIEKFLNVYIQKHSLEKESPNDTSGTNSGKGFQADQNRLDRISVPPAKANYGPSKFGRKLKTYYPFLNSMLGQGMIVIFIFLHHKAKEFVENDPKTKLNNGFLQLIEKNLDTLLQFEFRLSTKYITTSRMWSSNMVYLINRVLNLINMIYEKQEELEREKDKDQEFEESDKQSLITMKSASSSEEPSNSAPPIPSIEDEFPITTAQGNLLYLFNTNSFGDPSQFEYLNGFHLNDPNWLTVLDNIPYYLDPLVDGSKEQIADYKQYGPVTETTNGNIDTSLEPVGADIMENLSTNGPSGSNSVNNTAIANGSGMDNSTTVSNTIDPVTAAAVAAGTTTSTNVIANSSTIPLQPQSKSSSTTPAIFNQSSGDGFGLNYYNNGSWTSASPMIQTPSVQEQPMSKVSPNSGMPPTIGSRIPSQTKFPNQVSPIPPILPPLAQQQQAQQQAQPVANLNISYVFPHQMANYNAQQYGNYNGQSMKSTKNDNRSNQ